MRNFQALLAVAWDGDRGFVWGGEKSGGDPLDIGWTRKPRTEAS